MERHRHTQLPGGCETSAASLVATSSAALIATSRLDFGRGSIQVPATAATGGAAAAAATHDAASALALALTRVTTRKLRAIRCSPCTNTRIRGAFSTKRAVAHAVVSVCIVAMAMAMTLYRHAGQLAGQLARERAHPLGWPLRPGKKSTAARPRTQIWPRSVRSERSTCPAPSRADWPARMRRPHSRRGRSAPWHPCRALSPWRNLSSSVDPASSA